jgi:hypothetical protein
MAIVALGGLEVCDGAHWLIVMKKGQPPGLGEGWGTLLVQFQPLRSTNIGR